MAKKTYRAGAIGHTGHGGYGHGIHLPYRHIDEVDFVALSDPDPMGREKALSEAGGRIAYADYREMLANEDLELVSVCPRWVDQHEAMILACIDAGCHVYSEKPMTEDLASADRILEAAKQAHVHVAVAHQAVYLPQVHAVRELVQNGRIGDLLAMHAVGKQDRRGGGEDTLVLGTHLFNLMRFFAGDPLQVNGYVGLNGRSITKEDARNAHEPIGLIAGDCVVGNLIFGHNVSATFTSRRAEAGKGRSYGLVLMGSEGCIAMNGNASQISVLDEPAYEPWHVGQRWQTLDVPMAVLHADGNRLAILDLIDAIEKGRDPLSSADDARWTLEMIHGIYASHLAGQTMRLPLRDRLHPLK